MQYLTRRELEEIARQIAALGVKDTDFVWAEDLTEDDIFAIVQDGINKKYKLADFKDMIDQSAVEAALRAFAEEFKKTYDELLAIVDQLVIDANKDFQEDIELLVNSLKIQVADLEGNISQLIMRSDLIEARVANAEGDLAILSIRADEIAAEVSNAEGDIARLSVRADEISGRVSNAEGDVAVLSIRADEISSQVSNLAGDVSLISQRADSITTQVSDIEGNVSQLQQTALGFETRVSNVEGDLSIVTQRADMISSQVSNLEGDMSLITQRADQITSQVSNLEGDMSLISQRADEIEARVQNDEGDIASISIRADQIESRVSNAEGDISILHQTAQEFGTLITDMEGNMSSLTQTVNGVEVRVADVEGNVSVLEQTSTSLSSRITNAEGDISVLTQTAEGFATAVSNLEGDVSAISQRADSIDARVTNAEGDVAGLTIRADMIQSAVEDAEGNISLIQQTSEQIQSVVANQQGEISAITQRADSIESQVSNQQGQISIIRQTADEIQSVVANQQGQISGITQRADLIDLQVANINGDVAELSVRADEIESTVKNAEGDIAVLQQTAEGFDMRVSNVEGDVGQLILTAEAFGVRMSDAEGNIGQLELTASSLNSRISNAEGDLSLISQDIDSIEFRVQNTEGDLSLLAVDVDGIKASVQDVSSDLGEYEDYVNGVLEGIQEQIDGAIDTWFYNGTPTLNNLPASDWTTTELKDMHLGDVYYDNETGYAYRFTKVNGVYSWTEITDSAVVDALAKARKAQDTADGKRRVFVYSESHPTPYAPYDPGDLWVRPIQITVPGDSQPTNTTVLYRCITGRAENSVPAFVESEWGPADEKALVINRANLQVLSDSIVGEVSAYTYDSNGIIDSATQSRISQTADAIRLSVSNRAIGTALGEGGSINDTLLDTGIDITNGDITLTADHINLRNQNAVSGLQMITVGTGANEKVVIKVDSLDVSGVFTTSEWTGQNGIRAGILSDAETAAETYANSSAYLTNYVLPVVQGEISGLAVDSDYAYLKTALENRTTALGGLLLTSLIQLGATQSGGSWTVHSGISGIYDTTKTGNGIAAWYGGPMVDKQDHLSDNPMPDHALTLFRMDGSGYLADRNIWWDEDGNLTIDGYVLTKEIQLGYYDTATPPVWHVMSGISGAYSAQATGYGIATWYGGPKIDLADVASQEPIPSHAKTAFRMDGSGYLADGAITWGAAGDLHLLDNVYIGPNMDHTLASISTFITLLSTWFEDDTIVINGVTKHVLRINMDGDEHDTGFAGVVWNGFLRTGGDQIVIDGTPGGGGGGGGATTLAGLDDTNITNPQAGQMLVYRVSDNIGKWVNENFTPGSTYTAGYAISIAQSAISVAHTNEDTDPISFDPDTHSGMDASNLVEWGVSTHTDCAKLTIGVGSDSPVSKDLVLASGYDYLLGLINSQVSGVSSVAGKTGAVTLEIADVTGLQTALNGKQAAGNYLTSVPLATSSAIGGIQLGYTQSGKTYPVQLSSGKAYVSVPWENTTYSNATTSAAGLMSADDKSKLNGIAANANNYSLPTASSSTLGGIKIGTGLTIDSSGVVSVTGQTVGTVTAVKVGSTSYSPDGSGIVSLPAYPTVPTNVSAFTNDAGYITSYTNTWRNVYTGGTSRVGTGTDTKAVNFAAGSNVSISYKAAGTGSGQSGSANYFTVEIAATDTTYTNGTGISLSGTTFSLNVAGAKTALGLGSLAYKSSLVASDIPDISGTYLALAGGTMTGILHVKANQYEDAYNGSLDMANSDIYALNSIYTADLSNSQAEGIHFYRTETTVDTFRASNGVLYFAPNRTLGGTATEYTIIHSGNYSSQISVTNAMLAGSIENSKLNTIGVAKGGTGLTTWTGAYRLVYSTAATTLTTLAPNSTTTRKFLRQVGANNAATAPAWDTVTKTDVGLSNVPNWVYTIKDSSAQNFVN